MPRIKQEESLSRWTRFTLSDPLHVPIIKAFGKMIQDRFGGSFEEYCKNREKIGKKSYINKDGTICGVKDFYESNDHKIYYTRLPFPYLEDLSKWESFQSLPSDSPKTDPNLPF